MRLSTWLLDVSFTPLPALKKFNTSAPCSGGGSQECENLQIATKREVGLQQLAVVPLQ